MIGAGPSLEWPTGGKRGQLFPNEKMAGCNAPFRIDKAITYCRQWRYDATDLNPTLKHKAKLAFPSSWFLVREFKSSADDFDVPPDRSEDSRRSCV
jgi:hypothetical protein